MQLPRAVGAVVSSRTHAAQYCTQQFIEQFQDPALARGPYGLMVATRLPYLPAGVDQYNPEVKAIVMTIVSSSGALKVAGRHGINKSRKALRKAVTKVCVGGWEKVQQLAVATQPPTLPLLVPAARAQGRASGAPTHCGASYS